MLKGKNLISIFFDGGNLSQSKTIFDITSSALPISCGLDPFCFQLCQSMIVNLFLITRKSCLKRLPEAGTMGQKLSIPSRFCVSYLRRGHYNYIIIIYCHSCAGALLANLPCIFSILVYFPLMQVHHEKRSLKVEYL